MGLMSINRIKQLREALEGECLDTQEAIEIEEAFSKIPDSELRDLRENAMAADMLDELEERVSPFELAVYDYIVEHYGENEANDPCYDIGSLAEHLENKFIIKEK